MSIVERSSGELRERIERLSVEQRASLLEALEAELSNGGGRGAAGRRLVAYVAAESSPGLEVELRSFLEQSLPDYIPICSSRWTRGSRSYPS